MTKRGRINRHLARIRRCRFSHVAEELFSVTVNRHVPDVMYSNGLLTDELTRKSIPVDFHNYPVAGRMQSFYVIAYTRDLLKKKLKELVGERGMSDIKRKMSEAA